MRAGGNAHRPARLAALAAAGAAALLAAGCSSASSSSHLLSGSIGGNAVALLKPNQTTSSGTVLANGTGYTLYWFGPDSATRSACDDVCVPQWPPVTGRPRAASGDTLPGQLGTVIRSGGTLQATYDGHPLYTFAGDQDPGDVGGNNVVQFGGTWHVVRPG
jgi:predicted lipoprotein with Yx(FWY)xxD motif